MYQWALGRGPLCQVIGWQLKWQRSVVTGYPGDEHVFSEVVIVLARSPDCNLRGLVIFCVPAALLHCVVSDLSAFHLLCVSVDCECVSCVLAVSLSSLCAFHQLISKQQLTRHTAVGKRTAFSHHSSTCSTIFKEYVEWSITKMHAPPQEPPMERSHSATPGIPI